MTNTMTKNIIAFYKKMIIVNETNNNNNNATLVQTLNVKLMQNGYILSQELVDKLSLCDDVFIINLYNEIIPFLIENIGGKVNYKPFYPNFPQEVMEKSDFEIFVNAILHYWSDGEIFPTDERTEKSFKFEHTKFTKLNLGNENDFSDIFTNLLSINQSITKFDKDIINWFINNYDYKLPNEIPFKENLCFLASLNVENLPIKTVTDILRIVISLSGGDYNNKINKFKKFNRQERKYILNLFENTNCNVSEMVLNREPFIRLGEILHPSEYKNKFPKTFNAYNLLRNNKIKSFYGELNEKFKNSSLEDTLNFLSKRGGEYIRRMDYLVRTYPNQLDLIFKYFDIAIQKSSNKVIFELINHFQKRSEFFNRTQIVNKKIVQLKNLEPLDKSLVDNVIDKLIKQLSSNFSKLENLGNCYIDEKLKFIPLPTDMRNMNFSLKPVIRGQKIPFDFEFKNYIRTFVYWEDKYGTIDLDLSSTFIGDDKYHTLNFSSYGLKVGKSCHSGDIVARIGNNAEYIDIDVDNAINMGYKYVVLDVRNFRRNKISDVKPLFGLMEIEEPYSNDLWQPSTLSNSFMLTSNSIGCIIAMIDLVDKSYIFLDIDSESNVASNTKEFLNIVDKYNKLPNFSVYDLLMLHIKSRNGVIVDELTDDVENNFSFDEFSHTYEKIASFMGI